MVNGRFLSRLHIAAELEVSVGYLESSFGGEMKIISSMYEDVLYGESRNRIYELEAEVYVTLQRLADRGEELSWNKMCENLPEDIVRRFSKKELAHVRREAMPEITSGAYKEAVEHQKKAQTERIRRLYDLGVI